MKITNQEHLFHFPPDLAYLKCAYLSPIRRAAADAGTTGVDCRLRPWATVRREFFNELEEVRALFAQLTNAAFGGRSNFITLPLRQLLDWGSSNIQQAPMVAEISHHAADLGLLVPTPASSALFTDPRFDSGIPATLLGALIAANVHISLRGETLPVGPYLYNCATDIDLLVDVHAGAMHKHQRG
jgi:hypothetical protein